MKTTKYCLVFLIVFCLAVTSFSDEALALQRYFNDFIWPVDYNSSNYWISALDYYYDGEEHTKYRAGIDIYRETGQPGNIYAIADGEIVYKYDGCPHKNNINDTCGKQFGNHITIKHGENLYSLYAHLKQGSLTGATKVKAGDKIAEMGSSGMSSGPHLHLEIITSISFSNNGLDYTIIKKDNTFDYFKYNTNYLKKYAFKNGLLNQKKSRYYEWLNANYSETSDGYAKYKGNNHNYSECKWNDSGYCIYGEEYPIKLTSMSPTTYQSVKDNTPIRLRPYAPEPIIKRLSKGEAVTVIAKGKNSKGNTWYLLDDETWVYSENVKAAGKPALPSGVGIEKTGSNEAWLFWKPAVGAISYEVEYLSPTSNGWKADPDYKDKTSTSYKTTGLGAKVYQFRVRAVNSVGKSDWVTITYDGAKDTSNSEPATKPNKPSGFIMIRASDETARVYWKAVYNATYYEVQYLSPTSNVWKTDLDYKDKTSTSYMTTGLGAKVYQFRVRAVNPKGASDWVTITYDNTNGTSSSVPTTKPNNPTGLTMRSTGKTTARVSWNTVSNATSYEVQYFSPTSNGWKTDPDYKDKTSTSYITTELVAKKYEFRVRAVNSAGTSDWVTIIYDNINGTSSSGPVAKPNTPTGLTMTRASSSTARLSWNEVPNATFYEVEYLSPTSNGWKTDPDYKDKTSTSYKTTGLGAKVYQFRVRAGNSVGKSDWVTITYDGSTGSSR